MRDIEKQPGEILSGRQEGGMGAPWWFIGLRIQHCHYCGSGCCCGAASIPSLGPSACLGRGHQKKKKKKKEKEKKKGDKDRVWDETKPENEREKGKMDIQIHTRPTSSKREN